MTHPTSASSYDHPAAFHNSTFTSYSQLTSSCAHLRLNHTSYQHYHSSWMPNITTTDFTHTFVNLTKICHFCYICYLAFVSFIVFGCHLHALNLIHLRGRHAYRLCNTTNHNHNQQHTTCSWDRHIRIYLFLTGYFSYHSQKWLAEEVLKLLLFWFLKQLFVKILLCLWVKERKLLSRIFCLSFFWWRWFWGD